MHTPTKTNPLFGGTQKHYTFPNGWSASVVSHPHSYGGSSGLWELATITPGDEMLPHVKGWLTTEEVERELDKISRRTR